VRRFVVIGQKATTSPDFLLEDLPGTSGRLDVLIRALRAAMLVSHGIRRDTVTYLVLLGGPRPPKTVRFEGATVRFLRPEERSVSSLLKKVLSRTYEGGPFARVRDGIALAEGGLEVVLADLAPGTKYVLEEGAPDVRGVELDLENGIFFVGDHLGFNEETRATIASLGAIPLSIGPVSLHAEDAITIVSNETDRRAALV
jgi:tRNA (pseudouridine54-N1)-methyltransferase